MIHTKKVSQLPAADKPAATDLLVISQDDGDSTYTSKKITVVSFLNSKINVVSIYY